MSDSSAVPILQQEIGTRISDIANILGGRKAAALAAGVSEDMLYRYIRGESKPSLEAMAKLVQAAGCSLDWLATGHGTMRREEAAVPAVEHDPASCTCVDTLGNPVDLEEFVFIPRYNLKAAAGHGASVAGEAPMFSMSFRRYWVENYLRVDPKDLSVLSVKGDSMEGVLNNKDVILVNHADTAPTSGLYVLRLDGDLIVKRVQKLPGPKLKILSANEVYEPFVIDMNSPEVDFAVIGRVVWFGRQI